MLSGFSFDFLRTLEKFLVWFVVQEQFSSICTYQFINYFFYLFLSRFIGAFVVIQDDECCTFVLIILLDDGPMSATVSLSGLMITVGKLSGTPSIGRAIIFSYLLYLPCVCMDMWKNRVVERLSCRSGFRKITLVK